MKYTISVVTLRSVATLRETCVLREADILRKECGRIPANFLDRKDLAAVEWQNESKNPVLGVIPIALIARWASLVPHPELNIEFMGKGIRLSVYGHLEASFLFQASSVIDANAPIRLETGGGCEFRLIGGTDVTAEKKQMQLDARHEAAKKKALTALIIARGYAKTAMAAVKKWRKARALWATSELHAVTQARRRRDALRLVRRTLAAPQNIPFWANCDEIRELRFLRAAVRKAKGELDACNPRFARKREKFSQALRTVKRRRETVLRLAVARHLQSRGWHFEWHNMSYHLAERGSLSLARRTVRAWPATRLALGDSFSEAWHAYRLAKRRCARLTVSRDVGAY